MPTNPLLHTRPLCPIFLQGDLHFLCGCVWTVTKPVHQNKHHLPIMILFLAPYRTLRALSPGEEICISYVELAATRQERRQLLLETYHWDIDQAETAIIAPSPLASHAVTPPPTTLSKPSSPEQLPGLSEQLCLELRIQPQPEQVSSPVAAIPITDSAAAAAAAGHTAAAAAVATAETVLEISSSGTHIRWHGPMGQPPWRCDDPRDSLLIQVVTHTSASSSSPGGGERRGRGMHVVGGLTARVVQEPPSKGEA